MHQHLARMSLREKLAQMVVIDFRFDDADYDRTLRLVKKDGVGGIRLWGGSIFDLPSFVNSIQRVAKFPLLVAADYENGAGREVSGATAFPSNRAIGASGSEEFAQLRGRHTGLEARALGVRWVLSPVLAPEPLYCGDRALDDRLGRAAAKGLRSVGVLATATLRADGGPPTAGPMADVSALGGPSGPGPSLRTDSAFAGFVFIDASSLDPEAIRSAAGRGVDVLLTPADPDLALHALEEAVKGGSLPEAAIDRAVERILSAKEELGLFSDRMTDVASVEIMVGGMAPRAAAQRIAEAAVTLVRGRGRVEGSAALVKVGGGDLSVFETELSKRVTVSEGAERCILAVASGSPDETDPRVREAAARHKETIVVAFGEHYGPPDSLNLVCAYGTDPFSQRAAAKALAGEIEYRGRRDFPDERR